MDEPRTGRSDPTDADRTEHRRDPVRDRPSSGSWVDVLGVLLVLAGVALAVIRWFGADPLERNAESLLAAVTLGAVIAAPGVLCLIATRTDRNALLLPAAIVLALLSTLSPATLPLFIGALALAWRWARVGPGHGRLRGALATVVVVVGLLGAVVLLLVRTTERTFYGNGVVHSTDGWQPWSTSLLVLGLVALTVAVACSLVPAGSSPTRTP